jgi:hypothetical protein
MALNQGRQGRREALELQSAKVKKSVVKYRYVDIVKWYVFL